MNKSNDSKNSTRRRRVLVASILLAGLITIGGTFAWFTSKDEVTNKLTSTSNYGVSIVESFKPPKNWVPGQTVTKQAGVTNTGNVDAFAKVTLSSFIDVTVNYDGAELYSRLFGTAVNEYTLKNLNDYLATDPSQKGRELVKLTNSEVESIQAGGRLIYGNIKGSSADPDASNNKAGNRAFGIIPYATEVVGTGFKPYNYGLYIFERAVKTTDSNGDITYTYSYSGYYFVRDDKADPGVGTYYAIDIPKGSIVRDSTDYNKVSEVHISGAKIGSTSTTYTRANGITFKTTKLLQNNELYFEYDKNNKSGDNSTSTGYIFYDADKKEYYLKAIYYGEGESSTNNTNTANDIAIRIYLNDNYPSTTTATTTTDPVNWSINSSSMYYDLSTDANKHSSETATFYLNQVLMAGETSKWVITGVEIDPDVDDEAYVSFDYNLTLTADSIQVVYDSDGNIVTFDKYATDKNNQNSISASAVNGAWEDDQANVTKITKNTTGTPEYSVTWSLKSSKGIT